MNKRILAIIPARGGSKRLPGKNIMNLAGKPLIAWTIEAAKQSKYITDIVVSTDDDEIAKISKEYGAEVPFVRPDYLSNDTATSVDVVKHSIDFYKQMGKEYSYIMLLQPTSPLRTVEDINGAVELLLEKKADSVISMCECKHSPLWTNILPEDNSINNFERDELKNVRSQDLPTYYQYNGAIYITQVDRLLEEKMFSFNTNSYAYLMSNERSIDIDTNIDKMIAEIILGEG
ncbi:CMP-N-acetlyneuraminic acid synthetase [Labilibaculum manganireducens]|uniref:CMP-N-acetlyneuraminic acid synthetase n=1 Tax=Labilibaculum manganireducens TaxID=1940525 RepID=A0A2N3IEZ9_9BACT|nr:CMP-N-acetlyneuraminic acid synthetase [Labilibaculum manganireducens]